MRPSPFPKLQLPVRRPESRRMDGRSTGFGSSFALDLGVDRGQPVGISLVVS